MYEHSLILPFCFQSLKHSSCQSFLLSKTGINILLTHQHQRNDFSKFECHHIGFLPLNRIYLYLLILQHCFTHRSASSMMNFVMQAFLPYFCVNQQSSLELKHTLIDLLKYLLSHLKFLLLDRI